ncbi:hypothetical protein JW905_11350 [bacterium]|nr:hypothetical protein [candidate division CSSED10-310 bacterium]
MKRRPVFSCYGVYLQMAGRELTPWSSTALILVNDVGEAFSLERPVPIKDTYWVRAVVNNQGRQHATNVKVCFFSWVSGDSPSSRYEEIGEPVYVSVPARASAVAQTITLWRPKMKADNYILAYCTHYLDSINEHQRFIPVDRHVAQRKVSFTYHSERLGI